MLGLSKKSSLMSFQETLFKEFAFGVANTTGSLIVLAAFWRLFVHEIDHDDTSLKEDVKGDKKEDVKEVDELD